MAAASRQGSPLEGQGDGGAGDGQGGGVRVRRRRRRWAGRGRPVAVRAAARAMCDRGGIGGDGGQGGGLQWRGVRDVQGLGACDGSPGHVWGFFLRGGGGVGFSQCKMLSAHGYLIG